VAGQGATAKSCEMLVAEGFDVNVAILPAGEDPDTFVRRHGKAAYGELLLQSKPYLEYLIDRVGAVHDLNTDEGRVRFVTEMLPIAARIPDAAMRDRFADRIAFKARVTDEVVRAEIRKAAVQKQGTVPRRHIPAFGQVTKAEKGVIWWLIHHPEPALTALESLEIADFEGLAARSVLDLARKLNEDKGFSPAVLLERLSMGEAQLVTSVASEPEPPVHDVENCARMLRRLRYERERAALQREIDRLQQLGAAAHGAQIDALWVKKRDLLERIEELT
jgi:DNA primase